MFFKPIEIAVNAVIALFSSLKTGIQTIIVGILNGPLALLIEKFGPEGIAKDIQNLRETANETLVEFAGETQESLSTVFDADVSESANRYLERLNDVAQKAGEAVKEKLNTPVKEAIEEQKIEFIGLADTLSGFGTLVLDVFTQFGNKFNETVEFTEEQSKALAKAIGGTLAKGVTKSITSVVDALAKGEDAFKALGGAVLGLIADLAISVGQFILTTGIAKIALESLPGGATIAAGVGLIALGVLLKALSGSSFSGGGQAATSPIGGGTAAEPQIGSETALDADEDLQQKTGVTINVEGTIIDPKTTGENIATSLQEFFDASGGQLVVNA